MVGGQEHLMLNPRCTEIFRTTPSSQQPTSPATSPLATATSHLPSDFGRLPRNAPHLGRRATISRRLRRACRHDGSAAIEYCRRKPYWERP